jgi:hypothetical protein
MQDFVLDNIAEVPRNLIRLEYSEYERDDIVVEPYRTNPSNYTYHFLSYHRRDTYRHRVRYWKWDNWERKLSETK